MAHGQAGPNSAGATGSPLSSRFACSATCFAWCRRGRAQNHSQQGPAWRSGPHRRQGPFRTVRRELLTPRGFPHTNRHGERLGATCILSMPWPATALAGVRSVSREQVFCGFSTVWTLRSDTIWLQEWGWGWGGGCDSSPPQNARKARSGGNLPLPLPWHGGQQRFGRQSHRAVRSPEISRSPVPAGYRHG